MKLRTLLSFAILLTLGCSTTSHDSTSEISYELRPYEVETWKNGLEVIYIEKTNLPLLSMDLFVKSGSAADPMARSGLTYLMANTMEKGTKKRSALQIANTLGMLGTEFQVGVSYEYTRFALSGLSTHSKKLVEIFSDVTLSPRFAPQEVSRVKKNTLASISKRVDHPGSFARSAFNAYLFGAHPYARPSNGIKRDVRSITSRDLKRHYKNQIVPNNSILVVTGDVSARTKQLIKRYFGRWKKRSVRLPVYKNPPSIKGHQLRLVTKEGLVQSQVLVGHLGIKRDNPDYLPVRLANNILGGGNFGARLMSRIRTELGLTYGISSSMAAMKESGSFVAKTFTKNKSVGQTLDETLKVMEKFAEDGPTKDEVTVSKNYLLGAFPQAVETPQSLGYNLALLRMYGIGDDYLRNYAKNLQAISVDQVHEAAKKHLGAKNSKILIFGPPSTISQLRPFGPVEVRKYNQIF